MKLMETTLPASISGVSSMIYAPGKRALDFGELWVYLPEEILTGGPLGSYETDRVLLYIEPFNTGYYLLHGSSLIELKNLLMTLPGYRRVVETKAWLNWFLSSVTRCIELSCPYHPTTQVEVDWTS
jgi:hypothetical protein